MATAATARRSWEERFADHAAGLIYLDPLGPAVPGLNADGLRWILDDLNGIAATFERQAREAWDAGNMGLVQRAEGAAHARREAARQIVAYALTERWSVTE
jgi:uncharacterized protein YllA (UPF0747 family)